MTNGSTNAYANRTTHSEQAGCEIARRPHARLQALLPIFKESEDKREGRSCQENLDKQVIELLQHELPKRGSLFLVKLVWTKLFAQLLDVLAR